jgi:hypothetical protein
MSDAEIYDVLDHYVDGRISRETALLRLKELGFDQDEAEAELHEMEPPPE